MSESLVYGYVYLITNVITGMKYVGATTEKVKRRWAGHRAKAKRGSTYPLAIAIRRYGTASFTVETVAACRSYEDFRFAERYFIEYYDTHAKGYNTGIEGHGGKIVHRVILDGVVYPSRAAAIAAAGVSHGTMNAYLRDGRAKYM